VEVLDALLDDIDEILETNEVVRLFVQKPGE
jgi:ubiquitin-like protein Pup